MQKLTGKEIIVRKSEAKALLADALCFHDLCEGFCRTVEENKKAAMWFAFLVGVRLNEIKPSILLISPGEWMTWLQINFCEPRGITDRMARNYMNLATEHPKLISQIDWKRVSNGEVDYELVTQFKFDSIRKFSGGFVEEKSQPEHKDDFKFERSTSFLNIVNEFERIFSRHVNGLELIELDEVRRQTPRLFGFLKCVHETPELDPFVTS